MSVRSLVYLDCRKCKRETLHGSGVCVHCHCDTHEIKPTVLICHACLSPVPPRKTWRGSAKYCSRKCAHEGNKWGMAIKRA